MKRSLKIEFGDFQTPVVLAEEICAFLKREGVAPDVVLEPTCGHGAFVVAASQAFPTARLHGLEINADYLATARKHLERSGASDRAELRVQDFFAFDWDTELRRLPGDLLVLGNPPWVTNSTVAGLDGSNLPVKENFQRFRGIEARTGKSNFDISEWMLIRLIRALRGRAATIAMLCKTATARKLLRYAWQNDGRIAEAALFLIDTKRHFDASVDACLLLARTGSNGPAEAVVYESLKGRKPATLLGLAGADLVANIRTYRRLKHLEGLCPHQWRSGVKHDCVSVLELLPVSVGRFSNRLNEQVSLEPHHLYPLLKCSDLAKGIAEPTRMLLVTQKQVGDDTSTIAESAPDTWAYLNAHAEHFRGRKSSIYNARVPFAIFGIGEYAFAPWKVGVSGLHHHPRFVLVGPSRDRPVLFDDTCYFLSFSSEHEARVVADVLNSPHCLDFIESLIFRDTKRPVTVELLQRLNLSAIAQDAGLADRWKAVQRVTYSAREAVPQLELAMDKPRR
jgi:hypothetical protein